MRRRALIIIITSRSSLARQLCTLCVTSTVYRFEQGKHCQPSESVLKLFDGTQTADHKANANTVTTAASWTQPTVCFTMSALYYSHCDPSTCWLNLNSRHRVCRREPSCHGPRDGNLRHGSERTAHVKQTHDLMFAYSAKNLHSTETWRIMCQSCDLELKVDTTFF